MLGRAAVLVFPFAIIVAFGLRKIKHLENEAQVMKETIEIQKKKIKDDEEEIEELTKLYDHIEYKIDDCTKYIAALENKNYALRIENQHLRNQHL